MVGIECGDPSQFGVAADCQRVLLIPRVPSRRGRSSPLRGSPLRSRRSCPSSVPSVGSGRRARAGARRSCGPRRRGRLPVRPSSSDHKSRRAETRWRRRSSGSTSSGARPCLAASPEVFTSSSTSHGRKLCVLCRPPTCHSASIAASSRSLSTLWISDTSGSVRRTCCAAGGR